MDHATAAAALLATHFATSLFPLTIRLIPVITEIGRLIVRFRRAELTPQSCHQFETQLHDQLRELGRIIVEWTFNHLEPHDRRDMPSQMCLQGVWYRRRSKTPNRPAQVDLLGHSHHADPAFKPVGRDSPSAMPHLSGIASLVPAPPGTPGNRPTGHSSTTPSRAASPAPR